MIRVGLIIKSLKKVIVVNMKVKSDLFVYVYVNRFNKKLCCLFSSWKPMPAFLHLCDDYLDIDC